MSIPLAALEEIIDTSGIAPRVEALLPIGVRHRQLRVRTLLAGMLLTQADHRPAHLTRVRDALTALPAADQARLGVTEDWKAGPHQLTYRQTERTFGLVTGALAKDLPDGLPSSPSPRICDDLLEASIPPQYKQATSALAVDWTDVETFSRPPPHGTRDCADPEAWWGHRSGGGPGQDSELFFGYYASAGTMMREEHGPAVPELARRMTVCSCHADPARALVPVLTAMPAARHPARRHPGRFRLRPPRRRGLGHPAARRRGAAGPGPAPHPTADPAAPTRAPSSPTATCTARSPPGCCWNSGPLARDATPDQTAAHDTRSAELARYKLGKITADDTDGYHRVMCPAVMGKIRCPLRPASMTLDRQRPEILTPPEHPPDCCAQQTLTVPPDVAAKTRQKHDYPSAAHRRSYARRTGAERTFSTAKDPASNNIARGWCRLTGLAPLMLWLACLMAVRNQRILTAWTARQDDNARRAAAGLPPRTRRRRRRKTLTDLATAGTPP